MNNYSNQVILSDNTGNNAFSYTERIALGSKAEITIPSLQQIQDISEIGLGTDIVFEEIDYNGKLHSCTGLKHIYQLNYSGQNSPLPGKRACLPACRGLGVRRSIPIYIFDNHNHALYFRLQYLITDHSPNPSPFRKGEEVGGIGVRVTHIDQHSDLNKPEISLNSYMKFQGIATLSPREKGWRGGDDETSQLIYNYTNKACNIGNFLGAFLESYPKTNFNRIKSEYQLLSSDFIRASSDFIIIDIDLDFRAPEMSIANYEQTIQQTQKLISQADLVTIATSPFFIDQKRALEILGDLIY